MPAAETANKITYRVKADSVEACSCRHGCDCQFTGFPNDGKCEFVIGFAVRDGNVGQVSLNGVRAVVAAKYPKAIHEGNGHVVLFIDEKATQQQADAFLSILSGKLGGMPWEAIAGTIGKFEGPIRKPVEIEVAGVRSRVRVPGVIEVELKPLTNPVTGKENHVHIAYPKGGFFWNDGAVATTATMHARHGDFQLEWPNRFAAAAEVNWTNQA